MSKIVEVQVVVMQNVLHVMYISPVKVKYKI